MEPKSQSLQLPTKNIPTSEIGIVASINDYLITLDGLPTVKINDLIENEEGVRAYVTTLLENTVQALMLDQGDIKPGMMFKKANVPLTLKVGEHFLGRVINPLGVAIDGKTPFPKNNSAVGQPLENTAPGIGARKFITEQLQTGISLIDLLIPIGKGQRELVMGDARSGKSSFLISVIMNQEKYPVVSNQSLDSLKANNSVICIYAAIGKPINEIRNLIDVLGNNNALSKVVIIASASSDPAPLIFLTPHSAFTLAEYFQKKGMDVLLILDDLGIHAKIYREISLLSRKVPGRESYPGDIFYQHAHLLERAGSFKKEAGGGSITALPVIEINLNDFTTFIPTNLMGMTDGHLLFKSNFYNQGIRPAIDIPQSVSRVGLQTQSSIQKQLSSIIKTTLIKRQELTNLASFSNELSVDAQLIQKQGQLIEEFLKQDSLTFQPLYSQVLLFGLVFTNFFKDKPLIFAKINKQNLIKLFIENPAFQKVLELKNMDQLIKYLEANFAILAKVCK